MKRQWVFLIEKYIVGLCNYPLQQSNFDERDL